MVAMAGFYAVGGLSCHERHANASLSLKGLLLGVAASWIGVAIWTALYKGSPVAMGAVMGVVAMVFVAITKWRLMGRYQFVAMPQAFLGATMYFGLFNAFMMAKGIPGVLLFGWLQPVVLIGGAQPHIAGILAVISTVVGVVLGYVHQNISLYIVQVANPSATATE